jgi:hypothetical protein
VCRCDIETMRREAKVDVAAPRSEVGQLKKAANPFECLAQEAPKHSSEAAQKQLPHPLVPPPARRSSRPFRRSSTSSAGSGLCFCGAEAATVSARKTFPGDATAARTH